MIGGRQTEYYHSTVANNNHHIGHVAEMKPLNPRVSPGEEAENDGDAERLEEQPVLLQEVVETHVVI